MDLRKIDALVAEKVMGWRPPSEDVADLWERSKVWYSPETASAEHLPDYSSDIADAWEVVEKLESEDPGYFNLSVTTPPGWYVTFVDPDSCAYADTAPLAICLAALKAKGISYNDCD